MTECRDRRRNRTLFSLSLFRARERSFFSLSLSCYRGRSERVLTSNIRFSIYLTFRVSKFHALFSRFLGARFALDFYKRKDGNFLRVWREILPLPLSSHSTSHRRRQAPKKKEEEFPFFISCVQSLLCLSFSFSHNQSFAVY